MSDSKLNEHKDRVRQLLSQIEGLQVQYNKLEINISEYKISDGKR